MSRTSGWAFVDELGLITKLGCSLAVPAGSVPIPISMLGIHTNFYLSEGDWTVRPAFPDPAVAEVADELHVTLADCPPGASVVVYDTETATALATVEESEGTILVEFTETGLYRIAWQPMGVYRPTSFVIEVNLP